MQRSTAEESAEEEAKEEEKSYSTRSRETGREE